MSDMSAGSSRIGTTTTTEDGPLVAGARKVENAARTVKDKVSEGVGNAKNTLRTKPLGEMMSDAEGFIRAHPGRTVLISLGVGCLVGYLMARRPSNRES